ncbi:hypothetical protein J45TS6_33140 [Paenibacillus sp. J45TS6]|nr:hypothetical protein J45TS6_33140 [Paenibacillus sp. J45TS6]
MIQRPNGSHVKNVKKVTTKITATKADFCDNSSTFPCTIPYYYKPHIRAVQYIGVKSLFT